MGQNWREKRVNFRWEFSIKNVLGIGVIKSDYIEPKDPENPQIDYKHVRKVDWLITEKLENLSNKFDLKTVTLQNDFKKWEEIKKEYINKNPEYSNIFDKLIQNFQNNDLSGLIKSFLKEINTQELQRHRNEHNTRSKNVQEKLKEEAIKTLTEDEMLSLLKDTDAAYGVRFNLKDIFSENDGFEEFKKKIINLLANTNLNKDEFKKLIDSINNMGHGFLSELLCLKYPSKFWIWNAITENYLSKMMIDIKSELPVGKKTDQGALYIAMKPHMKRILDGLKEKGLIDATFLDVDLFIWWMKDKNALLVSPIMEQPKSPQFRRLYEALSHSKNIILYGPPGTGKTYIIQQFINEFLNNQLFKPKSAKEVRFDVIRDLTWYDLIALAMYLKEKSKKYKVADLHNDELISDYFSNVKGRTKNINATLWSQLQMHAIPDSKTVKSQNRNEPALFDKTPDAEWYLTSEGIEYAEANFKEALELLSGKKEPDKEISLRRYITFLTFHQSYAYEDFIEGIRPFPNGNGNINYRVEPGVFKDICNRAKNDGNNKYILVIDEINRGNIAKVFGEIITLIEDDKRLGEKNGLSIILPYSKDDFGVPSNLYVIGSMNTADRSIALLDIALRRRFTFLEMMPDYSIIDEEVDSIKLRPLLETINSKISSLIDRDHQIGHSYFCGIISKLRKTGIEEAKDELMFVWYKKIIPLMQEYFYNDGERLKIVLGDFISEDKSNSNDNELQEKALNRSYNIKEFENWSEFSVALNNIMGHKENKEESIIE